MDPSIAFRKLAGYLFIFLKGKTSAGGLSAGENGALIPFFFKKKYFTTLHQCQVNSFAFVDFSSSYPHIKFLTRLKTSSTPFTQAGSGGHQIRS